MMDLPGQIRQRVASEAGMHVDRGLRATLADAASSASMAEQQTCGTVQRADSWQLPEVVVNDLVESAPQIAQALAAWDNRIVHAASPVLLLLVRAGQHDKGQHIRLRTRLIAALRAFRVQLAGYMDDADIGRVSYLLCTFADEVMVKRNSAVGGGERAAGEPSFLVDIHNDAWGGEMCFDDLSRYLAAETPSREILQFYDLIFSLGLTGKYSVAGQGDVTLTVIRERLRERIFGHAAPLGLMLDVAAPSATGGVSGPKASLVFVTGIIGCLLAYGAGAWHLRAASAPTLASIASFEPDERPPPPLDIQDTLPPDISQLVSEGWLQVVKRPDGWLLLFTSDSAFTSAQAVLTPDYREKIARLGRALAPWPGALEVVGHTDNQPIRRSMYADNQALSLARANSVRTLLRGTANSLLPNRAISAVGRGDEDPMADNSTEQGRNANRRVDVMWKVLAHGGE